MRVLVGALVTVVAVVAVACGSDATELEPLATSPPTTVAPETTGVAWPEPVPAVEVEVIGELDRHERDVVE